MRFVFDFNILEVNLNRFFCFFFFFITEGTGQCVLYKHVYTYFVIYLFFSEGVIAGFVFELLFSSRPFARLNFIGVIFFMFFVCDVRKITHKMDDDYRMAIRNT